MLTKMMKMMEAIKLAQQRRLLKGTYSEDEGDVEDVKSMEQHQMEMDMPDFFGSVDLERLMKCIEGTF